MASRSWTEAVCAVGAMRRARPLRTGAGADLDEPGHALRGHVLNGLLPVDAPAQLVRQLRAQALGRGDRLGGGVGDDGDGRRADFSVSERAVESGLRGAHDLGVERARDVQGQSAAGAGLLGALDREG